MITAKNTYYSRELNIQFSRIYYNETDALYTHHDNMNIYFDNGGFYYVYDMKTKKTYNIAQDNTIPHLNDFIFREDFIYFIFDKLIYVYDTKTHKLLTIIKTNIFTSAYVIDDTIILINNNVLSIHDRYSGCLMHKIKCKRKYTQYYNNNALYFIRKKEQFMTIINKDSSIIKKKIYNIETPSTFSSHVLVNCRIYYYDYANFIDVELNKKYQICSLPGYSDIFIPYENTINVVCTY